MHGMRHVPGSVPASGFQNERTERHYPESRCLHGVRRLPQKLPRGGDFRGIRGGLRRGGNKFPTREK